MPGALSFKTHYKVNRARRSLCVDVGHATTNSIARVDMEMHTNVHNTNTGRKIFWQKLVTQRDLKTENNPSLNR